MVFEQETFKSYTTGVSLEETKDLCLIESDSVF